MGARRAVLVAALDVAKGFVPVAVATLARRVASWAVALAGIAAVLGAWRSIFLRFHGGRGVATGIGAALVIQPLVVLLAAPFFFGMIWLTATCRSDRCSARRAGAAMLLPVRRRWASTTGPTASSTGSWARRWSGSRTPTTSARLLRGEERKFDIFARGNEGRGDEAAPATRRRGLVQRDSTVRTSTNAVTTIKRDDHHRREPDGVVQRRDRARSARPRRGRKPRPAPPR